MNSYFFMVKPPCFTLFSSLKTTIFQLTIPITTPFFTIIFQLPWSPHDPNKSTCFPAFLPHFPENSGHPPALDKVLGSAQLMLPPRSPRSKSRSGKAILVGGKIPRAMGISMEISWEYWWQEVENGVILWMGYHWSVVGYQWYILEQ